MILFTTLNMIISTKQKVTFSIKIQKNKFVSRAVHKPRLPKVIYIESDTWLSTLMLYHNAEIRATKLMVKRSTYSIYERKESHGSWDSKYQGGLMRQEMEISELGSFHPLRNEQPLLLLMAFSFLLLSSSAMPMPPLASFSSFS